MTDAEKIKIEHRLTEVEERSKSNTKRIDEHDEKLKNNYELIGAIKELAVETKHLREDVNETIARMDALESKDGEAWDKFKWLLVAGVVSIILGYIAVTIGLK